MTDAFNPNDHFQQLPSEKYADLPKETRDFLDELRPDEVDVIRQIARMPADEVAGIRLISRMSAEELTVIRQIARLGKDGTKQLLDAIKLAQSVMTVGRFARWAIIGLLGVFFGAVLLAEKIMQVVSWFSSGGSPK